MFRHLRLLSHSKRRSFSSGYDLEIVDVGALIDPNASLCSKQSVARDLHRICCNTGFLLIRNHGISMELKRKVLDVGEQFFQLPLETKNKVAMNGGFRGYQYLGQNVTQGKNDLHEGYDWHYTLPKDHPHYSTNAFTYSPNHWSQEPSGFEPLFRDYVSQMENLGSKLMEGLALGLDLPLQYFHPYFKSSQWCMRLIGYPAKPDSTREEGCGVHSDYGCLTLLNATTHENCLQVRDQNGEWVFVNCPEDCYVINLGDMLHIWTNGRYQATSHCVQPPKEGYRVSVVFFYEPNFDAWIEPLFQEDAKEKKTGKMYGHHALEKALNNFEYRYT